jgi:outer membrane protein OmpA-like peptidoglycan-associated protein
MGALWPLMGQTQVTWACKVIESNDDDAGGYGPKVALAGPDNLLAGGQTFDAWFMGFYSALNEKRISTNYESAGQIYAVFEFCKAEIPGQIIITEPLNAGSITNVILIDDQGVSTTIYNAAPNHVSENFRMWSIPVSGISKPIKRIKIISEPSKVKGWNVVSAVGITASTMPYKPSASIISPEPFLNIREGFSPMLDDFKDLRSAALTSDNKTMYLTVHHTENNSDMYISQFENGVWSKAVNMGKPINNEKWNFPAGVTPCNNILFLVNRYNKDGSYLDGSVSVSYKTKSGWTMPENLILENWRNTHKYESYTVSYDNKYIVGQIAHDICYGEGDLYAFVRKADGTYGPPINLGPTINTPEDECNPFLGSDGKTLYFCSNGHPGYGALDVFMTRRLDDTWTKWSVPTNLGPRINSYDSELSFRMSSDGKFAYGYYSNEKKGKMDIYRVNIAPNSTIRPMPVHFFCGSVHDGKTGKEMAVHVRIENLETGKTEADFISNKYNGAFQMMMEDKSGHYAIYADAPGYISVRQEYKIEQNNQYTEHSVDLLLYPLELNAKVTLNTVYFKQSSPDLMPQSISELGSLVEIMNKNPKMRIEIRGHTDNVGNPKDLYKLSLDRANSVKSYLIQQGIDASRISTKGFGGTMPVNSNKTEEERLQNRRVEFLITQF